jgi:hypothetical protein
MSLSALELDLGQRVGYWHERQWKCVDNDVFQEILTSSSAILKSAESKWSTLDTDAIVNVLLFK